MQNIHPPQTLQDFVREAATSLQGQGWKVVRRRHDPRSPWHLLAHKGEKWRVIQIQPPATSAEVAQEGRLQLGDLARLPSSLGSMEQWLAHLRPDGKMTFGPYVLSAQRWAGNGGSGEDLLDRLGLRS